ncbi:MAG: hypothetical protein ACK5JO_18765, partial [Halodesulfovibrio sp.]
MVTYRQALKSSSAFFTIACLWQGTAFAQEQEQGNEDSSGGSIFMQDIVVTATRREERLNTVPVSVTAVSAAQVEALGAENVTDIQSITPNFNVQAVVTRPNDP